MNRKNIKEGNQTQISCKPYAKNFGWSFELKYFLILAGLSLLIIIFVFPTLYSHTQSPDKSYIQNNISLITQTSEDISLKSDGCRSCHTKIDNLTMHKSPMVRLGCTDCHGGDSRIFSTNNKTDSKEYLTAKNKAHVLPKNKNLWKSSANPQGSYTALLKEKPEFVKFHF